MHTLYNTVRNNNSDDDDHFVIENTACTLTSLLTYLFIYLFIQQCSYIPNIAESWIYAAIFLYLCETKADATIFDCSIFEA